VAAEAFNWGVVAVEAEWRRTMRAAPCRRALLAALLAAATSTTVAQDTGQAAASPLYGLIGDPIAEQTLLAARWGSTTSTMRFDTTAGLGAHEVRVLSAGSAPRWAPQFSPMGADSRMTDLNVDLVRATYRYTLLAEPGWEMKVGLSTNLSESANVLRPVYGGGSAFGSLPTVHLAGAAQWSPRWRLAFAVDGLATTRGRAIDLDVQVDYLMSPAMSVFGGYQLTDAAGDAEGFYGSALSNRANIGLRFRV
jgi:hypothetical protein